MKIAAIPSHRAALLAALAAGLATGLCGCGQTGPLYLPDRGTVVMPPVTPPVTPPATPSPQTAPTPPKG